jgi:hypothetical protein
MILMTTSRVKTTMKKVSDICVSASVRVHACSSHVCACMHACACMHVHACKQSCVCVYACVKTTDKTKSRRFVRALCVCVCVCVCVCMHAFMCVCVCV